MDRRLCYTWINNRLQLDIAYPSTLQSKLHEMWNWMLSFQPCSNTVCAKRMMGDKLLHLLIVVLFMTRNWRLWMKYFTIHLDEQSVEDHIIGGEESGWQFVLVASHPTSHLPTQIIIYGRYAINSFTKSGGYAWNVCGQNLEIMDEMLLIWIEKHRWNALLTWMNERVIMAMCVHPCNTLQKLTLHSFYLTI